ncbi:hypothetical protein Cantr_00620 [Candida viswanathii]|uniref:Uncharacterized protein n=1 Tax=Candida viswanathii TaxID=5486 RepID=A0A367YGP6_9ASCO|nr:hypothetical protein Cantr_00620 [Candida viswanathii]
MSGEPEVAPYGGFMIKTLEDESKSAAELTTHQHEVTTAAGTTETIRPESLTILGVDSLSTSNIESYVNYYLNYVLVDDDEPDLITGELGTKYAMKPNGECIEFRIEWVNDTAVNVIFKTVGECSRALKELRSVELMGGFDVGDEAQREEYVRECAVEVPAKSYNPVIEFQKMQEARRGGAATEKKKKEEVEVGMDEDESSVELLIRQSFQLDRKVKNAREYSRYYLIHGEPDRRHSHRGGSNGGRRSYRERDSYRPKRNDDDEEEDLFAEKLGRLRHSRRDEEEEDLFADKLRQANRDRSPTRR